MSYKLTFLQYLEINFIRFFAWLAKILPRSISHSIFCGWGNLAYLVLRQRRKITIENLSLAFGNSLSEKQKNLLARKSFQNASLSMMELFIVKKTREEISNRVKFFGLEHWEEAFSRGKGVVLITAHLGSWEYLSFLSYFAKHPVSVIVKEVKNSALNEVINEKRRVMNVDPISKNGPAVRAMFRELKSNHCMAILIDQWAGDEGIESVFFGKKTSTTSIPAKLAKKTGCAIISGRCLRSGVGQYEIHVDPPVEYDLNDPNWESVITENINRRLEQQILENPNQWIWGHRRWKKL